MEKSGSARRRRAQKPGPPVVTYVEGERLVLNKATGFGYLFLPDGTGARKRFYMGRFEDPGTLGRASRFLREYKAAGGPPRQEAPVTIRQVADRFLEFAKGHYGEGSSRIPHYRVALDFLCERYGDLGATDFGPLKLLAVRDAMVASGRWNRIGVNERLAILKRAFRWAASREIVPAAIPTALETVENIDRGRTTARESRRVRPVPDAHVDAVLPLVSRQVRAMIEIQRLTGMRAGEIVQMRPGDVEREGEVWLYRPERHKTQHLDHDLVVAIGPRAQAVLAPFLLGRGADARCFSAAEAEAGRRAALHEKRVTPPNQGNRPGSNRKRSPAREPGDAYTVASYRRAIERACGKAGVPLWRPHQLRHNRGTELRRKYGIEVTRIMLGHRDAKTTQIYAEADIEVARRIAKEVG